MNQQHQEWTTVIGPQKGLFDLKLREVWQYRDLLALFVRRDFVSNYKQTIMGPLWFFIQPLFTTLVFLIVFSRMANLPTSGIPPILFYMSGIVCWNYFADCLNRTANTFKDNQGIFGKVYFPRMIVPISVVVTNGLKFGIQFLLFLSFYAYYAMEGSYALQPQWALLLLPLLLLMISLLGLGFGILFTSLTTKYRDLVFLLQFGIQLAMYATPVIYPLSSVPEKYKTFFLLNPMSSIIETFKYAFFGQGYLDWTALGCGGAIIAFLLVLGVVVFNHTERSFIDTV